MSMIRTFTFSTAFALTLGIFAGCSDTTVQSTPSDDAFAMYVIDNAATNDFSEIQTGDDLVSSDPVPGGKDSTRGAKDPVRKDSTRGAKDPLPGGKDSTRGEKDPVRKDSTRGEKDPASGGKDSTRGARDPKVGSRDFGKFELRNYDKILRQLQFTDRQAAAIRLCFADYRECATSSATRYRNARAEMSQTLKNGITRIRAAVEGGTMTREEAAAAIARLNQAYREDVATLNAAFKAAVDACTTALDSCIEGHLSADQLVRWHRLKH